MFGIDLESSATVDADKEPAIHAEAKSRSRKPKIATAKAATAKKAIAKKAASSPTKRKVRSAS